MSLAFKLHPLSASRAPGRDRHAPHSRAILEQRPSPVRSCEVPAPAPMELLQRVRAVMWLLVGTVTVVDLLATFIFRAG